MDTHYFLVKGNRRSLLRIKNIAILCFYMKNTCTRLYPFIYYIFIYPPGVLPIQQFCNRSRFIYNKNPLCTMVIVEDGVCRRTAEFNTIGPLCLFEKKTFNIYIYIYLYNTYNINYDAIFRWNFNFQYLIFHFIPDTYV